MADGQSSNSLSLGGHGGTSICKSDVESGGEEAVVTFDGIASHTPRGPYNVELHLSFLRLHGQANNDFKISYTSITRVFWLPKLYQPHTFVVLTLDPPIENGQTSCPHIVMQGLIHEIFVTILSGLSDAEVTKMFCGWQNGYALKSSLESEDGFLYPLEDNFFFLPIPPTLILHEEIDYVEFERRSAGGSNMHYVDFLIRLTTGQEHLFRNIPRNDFQNLFTFVHEKGLKILNLGGLWATEGNNDNPPMDPYIARILNAAFGDESDDEVEYDEGSPTDDDSG
ncbi:fact complex subunit ssrp1 [Phtheirospermum japonicum]|uniref:FACT complex subunit SSRP1 n=1 Tax=Phtheirospermum japonicum TaxID=374723 RepID=A0A830BVD6_9LAMI|nr:fact complex subunit ssrp1 [Phtheirospermum japonicum]